LPVAPAPQGLRPHPQLRLPRQPPTCHSPAALLATSRCRVATPDRTTSLPYPGTQPALALSPMWWAHGGYRQTYGSPDPTPFSTLPFRSRRMKLLFQAPALGATHHSQAWCALLAPKTAVPSQPGLKPSLLPHANYNQTIPAFAFSSPSSFLRSLSHNPNPIEFP